MFLFVDSQPNPVYIKQYTRTPSFRDPAGNLKKDKILKQLLPIGSKLKTKTITVTESNNGI